MKRHWRAEDELASVPPWVPNYAARYLAHIEKGVSIRELARHSQCHASTISRQIRRVESRRDDPLIDEALATLGAHVSNALGADRRMETFEMNAQDMDSPLCEAALATAAEKILLKLSDPDAVLAVAKGMEKAVVVRDGADGATLRTAVVDRDVAQAMALKDWISCKTPGRVSRYKITPAGRSELTQLMAKASNSARDFAEEQTGFEKVPTGVPRAEQRAQRRMRFTAHESPLSVLARRKDKDGKPFLSSELVAAGERLREDFELSQMEGALGQNWDRFLTAGTSSGGGGSKGDSAWQARDRLREAMELLGEGLADITLRCCCYLEGLEMTERRLGWPARSGKVVLRIALVRLREHYNASHTEVSDMIG